MEVRFNHERFCLECMVDGDWHPITPGFNKATLSVPSQINTYRIEVSLSCNLQCKYCVVHMNNVRQQNTMMSIKTAKSIINKYNDEVGVNGSIFLMGGEPLTNASVVKYIIEHTNGLSVVFTNALLLDDSLIDFFQYHNTYILTSLDGYTIKQNEKRFWPNVQSNFNIVTYNIKRAIEKGCKVGVSCLLHNSNVNEAGNIAEYFAKDLGARAMSFSYPHRTMASSQEDCFDFEKYSKSIIDVYDVAKRNGVYIDQIGKIMSCIAYGSPRILGCKAGTTQRTFYPDGSETICTKIDTQNGFLMDNYISNLPYYNQDCSNCIAHGFCSGECPWDFFVAINKKENGHKRVCGFYKCVINHIINDIKHDLSFANSIDEAKEIFNNKFLPLTKNYTN